MYQKQNFVSPLGLHKRHRHCNLRRLLQPSPNRRQLGVVGRPHWAGYQVKRNFFCKFCFLEPCLLLITSWATRLCSALSLSLSVCLPLWLRFLGYSILSDLDIYIRLSRYFLTKFFFVSQSTKINNLGDPLISYHTHLKQIFTRFFLQILLLFSPEMWRTCFGSEARRSAVLPARQTELKVQNSSSLYLNLISESVDSSQTSLI